MGQIAKNHFVPWLTVPEVETPKGDFASFAPLREPTSPNKKGGPGFPEPALLPFTP
jgi:hypothetical protein